MKNYPFYLLFCLFSTAAVGQEPAQNGVRIMTPLIFTTIEYDNASIFASSTARLGVQLGIYRHWPVKPWFSVKGEFNYSLSGYTSGVDSISMNIRKINYHYLGATLLPAFHAGQVVSFQTGIAANYLFNSPPLAPVFTSSTPRLDFAVVAGISLRYDQLEVQVRYHHSMLPFTPEGPTKALFRSLGLGLGYYFN